MEYQDSIIKCNKYQGKSNLRDGGAHGIGRFSVFRVQNPTNARQGVPAERRAAPNDDQCRISCMTYNIYYNKFIIFILSSHALALDRLSLLMHQREITGLRNLIPGIFRRDVTVCQQLVILPAGASGGVARRHERLYL